MRCWCGLWWLPQSPVNAPWKGEFHSLSGKSYPAVFRSCSRKSWPIGNNSRPYLRATCAIDGLVDGAWLTRSFTVVHCNDKILELGVKIEQYGQFSGAVLEEPTLSGYLTPGRPITINGPPLMCLVAGIGVTPAMAALRAVSDEAPRCYLYLPQPGRCSYLGELEDAAKDGLIEFRSICTTETGRADLTSLINTALDASGSDEALVCGPPEWAETVTALLKEKGITVRTEAFTHSGLSNGPALVCPGEWRDTAKPPKTPNWTQHTVDTPGTQQDEARSFIEQFFGEA